MEASPKPMQSDCELTTRCHEAIGDMYSVSDSNMRASLWWSCLVFRIVPSSDGCDFGGKGNFVKMSEDYRGHREESR